MVRARDKSADQRDARRLNNGVTLPAKTGNSIINANWLFGYFQSQAVDWFRQFTLRCEANQLGICCGQSGIRNACLTIRPGSPVSLVPPKLRAHYTAFNPITAQLPTKNHLVDEHSTADLMLLFMIIQDISWYSACSNSPSVRRPTCTLQ
jgi:hypothetical protein